MNLSRLLASATAFFVLAAASGPASADGAATCDPTNALECQQIALNYTLFNAPPFPVDPDRADALARLAVDGALEGCAGADYTLCYTLGDEALPLAADADPERYSLAARVAAYRSLTEAGCERGDPEACYWRSVLYKVNPSIIAMGIEAYMASGLTRPDAAGAVVADNRHYEQQAMRAAALRVPALRGACDGGETAACGQLGMLIKDFDLPVGAPFEKLPLLAAGCSDAAPRYCRDAKWAFVLSPPGPDKKTFETVREAALATVEAGCDGGDLAKCDLLADMTGSLGLDVLKGQTDARHAKACEMGSGTGCHYFGARSYRAYRKSGETDDLQKAVEWFTQACENGHNLSCHYIEHLAGG